MLYSIKNIKKLLNETIQKNHSGFTMFTEKASNLSVLLKWGKLVIDGMALEQELVLNMSVINKDI